MRSFATFEYDHKSYRDAALTAPRFISGDAKNAGGTESHTAFWLVKTPHQHLTLVQLLVKTCYNVIMLTLTDEFHLDPSTAQVVVQKGLAAVGHTVKMFSEGKEVTLPVKRKSPSF